MPRGRDKKETLNARGDFAPPVRMKDGQPSAFDTSSFFLPGVTWKVKGSLTFGKVPGRDSDLVLSEGTYLIGPFGIPERVRNSAGATQPSAPATQPAKR